MSQIINAKDGQCTVDAAQFQKFSDVTGDVTVSATAATVALIQEYIAHAPEGAAPQGQVQLTWTVATVFPDNWDGAYFTRVQAAYPDDPFLTEFAQAVNALGMTRLFRKVAVTLAIGMIARAGSIRGDRLAEEFNRLALRNKV